MTTRSKLIGTGQPGMNPAMQEGWPGVTRVLTFDERRAFERDWDNRFSNRPVVDEEEDG